MNRPQAQYNRAFARYLMVGDKRSQMSRQQRSSLDAARTADGSLPVSDSFLTALLERLKAKE